MKNTFKLFGNLNQARSAKVPLLIIALAAVMALSMIACDNGTTSKSGGGSKKSSSFDTSLNGTWVYGYDAVVLTINNGSIERKEYGLSASKGTYTTSGSSFTMTVTQVHGDIFNAVFEVEGIDIRFESKWYTNSELRQLLINEVGMTSTGASNLIRDSGLFTTLRGTYSINGNELTITTSDGTDSFTKE